MGDVSFMTKTKPNLAVIAVLVTIGLLGALPAAAQSVTVDLGDQGTLTERVIQLLILVTVLSLAPSSSVTVRLTLYVPAEA